MACNAIKPIVDGIEKEYTHQLIVLRVNVQDPIGGTLGNDYDLKYTPSFVFFAADGREQWRSIGRLDPEQVKDSLP